MYNNEISNDIFVNYNKNRRVSIGNLQFEIKFTKKNFYIMNSETREVYFLFNKEIDDFIVFNDTDNIKENIIEEFKKKFYNKDLYDMTIVCYQNAEKAQKMLLRKKK